MLIKLFTIVKDEVDIVDQWVHYHGRLVGYENLHIVDNISTDGTYERLEELRKKHGCHLWRLEDYTKKGDYMSILIRQFCQDTVIAYPLDIDEFIVHYDKQTLTVSCDSKQILDYFQNTVVPIILSNGHYCFKTNYIFSKVINQEGDPAFSGYANAVLESTHGYYSDYSNKAKTFFSARYILQTPGFKIDHGNHYETNDFLMTDLVLLHYHTRSHEQMIKKITNNCSGLGYPVNDVNLLSTLPWYSAGGHHIANRIKILNGTYAITIVPPQTDCTDANISLQPMIEHMKSFFR